MLFPALSRTLLYDYQLNSIYTLRYGKLWLSNNLTYRMNTTDNNGYKYGNRVSAISNLINWQNMEGITLLPSAGEYYENAKADEFGDEEHIQIGGENYYANLGVNVYISNLALGATLQKSLSNSDHHANKVNDRTMLNLTYMF